MQSWSESFKGNLGDPCFLISQSLGDNSINDKHSVSTISGRKKNIYIYIKSNGVKSGFSNMKSYDCNSPYVSKEIGFLKWQSFIDSWWHNWNQTKDLNFHGHFLLSKRKFPKKNKS